MELIAPAGSWAGMVASIEAGADAAYLGLQDWNARNRATNFTTETFRDACIWCHERGRRVYLTLNTLLRDHEVSSVMSMLGSDRFQMPDAIIVSDPGLMRRLRESFPDVDLHASTQFGAHNAEDLRFLKGLGIRRVVLARELTLTEIRRLAECGEIELEVFAWGSQCLGISGDCALSGLLLGGSGDRGRCLGPCRDLHRAPGTEGQLLYPNDIDIGEDHVRRLMKMGVAALKVEGRMRSPDALSEIVSRLRGYIDESRTTPPTTVPTASYLGGLIPVPGYIRHNPPVACDCGAETPLLTPGNGDEPFLKAKWSHLYPARLGDESAERLKSGSGRISFLEPIHFDRTAASVGVVVAQGTITELDCVDAGGGRCKVSIPPSKNQNIQITFPDAATLARELRASLKELSIYDVTVSGEVDGAIRSDLHDLSLRIRSAVSPMQSHIVSYTNHGGAPALAVESFHESHIRHFLEGYDVPVIVPVLHLSQVAQVIKKYGGEDRIVFRLPEMDWKSAGVLDAMKLVRGHGIMITRLQQLCVVKAHNPPFIEADYTIDCWNGATVELARDHGVRRIAVTPEWSLDEALAFGRAHHLSVETIIAGRLTAMITRHCWSDTLGCKGRCKSWRPMRNLEKGYGLRLHCEAPGLRRLVFEDPLPVFGLPPTCGVDHRCRYVASYDSMEEIHNTMTTLTAPLVPEANWQSMVELHPGWTSRLRGSVK